MVSSYTSEGSFVLKVVYELIHLLLKGEVDAEDAELTLTRRAKYNNNHSYHLRNTCYVPDKHTS